MAALAELFGGHWHAAGLLGLVIGVSTVFCGLIC